MKKGPLGSCLDDLDSWGHENKSNEPNIAQTVIFSIKLEANLQNYGEEQIKTLLLAFPFKGQTGN